MTSSITGRQLPGGGVYRIYNDVTSDTGEPAINTTCVPYCSMAQAQLSFHGHKDAVKFFVAVPGADQLCFINLLTYLCFFNLDSSDFYSSFGNVIVILHRYLSL